MRWIHQEFGLQQWMLRQKPQAEEASKSGVLLFPCRIPAFSLSSWFSVATVVRFWFCFCFSIYQLTKLPSYQLIPSLLANIVGKSFTVRPDCPVLKVFFLPDGHRLLKSINQPAARVKSLAPVGGRDYNQHAGFAYLKPAQAVDDAQALPIHREAATLLL